REGLIDTAVKTATSGYFQRCVTKGIESAVVAYDGSVRNDDGSILQFLYGGDGLDVSKTSLLHDMRFAAENYQGLIARHMPPAHQIGLLNGKLSKDTTLPPQYTNSPYTCMGAVSEAYTAKVTEFMSKASIKKDADTGIIAKKGQEHKFGRPTLSKNEFKALANLRYMRALVEPGESVGVVAAQGIGEPSTQMTLNTFHLAGHGAANVTLGIPRLREIVMTATRAPKSPLMTLYPPVGCKNPIQVLTKLGAALRRVPLASLVSRIGIEENVVMAGRQYKIRLTIPGFVDKLRDFGCTVDQVRKCVLGAFCVKLDQIISRSLHKARSSALDGAITAGVQMPDVSAEAEADSGDEEPVTEETPAKKAAVEDDEEAEEEEDEEEETGFKAEALELNAEDIIHQWCSHLSQDLKIQLARVQKHTFVSSISFSMAENGVDAIASVSAILGLNDKVLMAANAEAAARHVLVKEVPGISACYMMERPGEEACMQTSGCNLAAVFSLPGDLLDHNRIQTNHVAEVLRVFGAEAAFQAIVNEVSGVFGVYGIDVNERHLSLIADTMTHNGAYQGMSRLSMPTATLSPLLRASFETSTKFLFNAALFGEVDSMTSPAASIAFGALAKHGTGKFDLLQKLG
ncbi:DNA-directed RNA pol I, largest subunit, partial [Kipferlia bialata]